MPPVRPRRAAPELTARSCGETPGGANEMYLNVCPGKTSGPGCGTDDGTFGSHAGPITISDTGCFTAVYKMRNEKDTVWLINGKRSYGPRC
ncbi:hypothetical protein GCM10010320_24610 [Streptomyces caelestis]|nr:hypothetical protein GCM10010320_24610 [Streptomyces caelestis]